MVLGKVQDSDAKSIGIKRWWTCLWIFMLLLFVMGVYQYYRYFFQVEYLASLMLSAGAGGLLVSALIVRVLAAGIERFGLRVPLLVTFAGSITLFAVLRSVVSLRLLANSIFALIAASIAAWIWVYAQKDVSARLIRIFGLQLSDETKSVRKTSRPAALLFCSFAVTYLAAEMLFLCGTFMYKTAGPSIAAYVVTADWFCLQGLAGTVMLAFAAYLFSSLAGVVVSLLVFAIVYCLVCLVGGIPNAVATMEMISPAVGGMILAILHNHIRRLEYEIQEAPQGSAA